MTAYIISFDVYHDNGALDPHVFPTLEAAIQYIHTLRKSKDIPVVDDANLSACIYEVGAAELTDVDCWFAIPGSSDGEIEWAHSQEEQMKWWDNWSTAYHKSRTQK